MSRAFALLALLASYTLPASAAAQSAEPENEANAPEPQPDDWVVVKAGTLIAEPGKPAKRNQTIVIKNGKIDRVEAAFVIDAKAMPNAKIIDLSNSFVLPGLIDAHVHFTAGNDDGDGEAFGVATILRNAKKVVGAGVTTVRDMGSSGLALPAYQKGWADSTFSGPRVVWSGTAISSGVDDGDCYDASSCKKAVRTRFAQDVNWIKLYATCSGFDVCGIGKAPGLFTQDELDAVFSAAATRAMPVAAHAHSVRGINDALRAGARSIEHGSYLDQESIKLFREKNAYLVPTLAVLNYLEREREDASDAMLPVFEAALSNHPKGVASALQAGVMIGAGSDAPLTPFGDFYQELEWLVKIGMTPAQALRAATIVNAQLLMLDREIGTLDAGKSADIIAVPTDPTIDVKAMRSVEFVMVRGEVLKSASTAAAKTVAPAKEPHASH